MEAAEGMKREAPWFEYCPCLEKRSNKQSKGKIYNRKARKANMEEKRGKVRAEKGYGLDK